MPVMDSASGLKPLNKVIMSVWMNESVHTHSGKDRVSFLVRNIFGLISYERVKHIQ